MPNIGRSQILANLQASLAAMPGRDPEAVFKEAVVAAGLKDKPFFTPEETALVARAIMEKAQAEAQAAIAASQAALAQAAEAPADG
jgi:hypothetical protein